MIQDHCRIERIPAARILEAEINSNVMEPLEFNRLKENIANLGFSDPIKVEREGENYRVIDGHHRLRALKELGLEQVPCIVLGVRDSESKLAAVNFNTLRGNQNPKALARILKQLELDGYTKAELADKLVYDAAGIEDRLELLSLPDNLEDLIREREAHEAETAVTVWSFLVPNRYGEDVKRALKMFGEPIGEGFGRLCKKLVEETHVPAGE